MQSDLMRAAFLRRIQKENNCEATGKPCRYHMQCGCWLEMADAIERERAERD